MRWLQALGFATACCCFIASNACGPVTVEEQTLTRFFQAARTLDSSITTKFATVGFNPRTDGSVQAFQVTAVGPEQPRAWGFEKEVTIDATVRSPEGRMVSRTMAVTLQRSVTAGGPTPEGRWMITGLRPAPASRTSRATSSAPPS